MKTFDDYKKSMLSRVKGRDKRTGSIIYDAIVPTAYEFEALEFALEYLKKNMFISTADSGSLVKHARQYGIFPKQATCAIIKGEFNIKVPVNSRFNHENINYRVTEFIESEGDYHYFKMISEQPGSVGNSKEGTLLPIETISGLTHAKISKLLIPGEDIEDIEEFRNRVLKNFNKTSFGGNKADYVSRINLIDGVGAVKAERTPSGPGTVKVMILDSNYNAAGTELIEKVQEEVDPLDLTSEGEGIAPIGHRVVIGTPSKVLVNVVIKATYEQDSSFGTLKKEIEEVLEEYLLSLRLAWETSNELIVRNAHLIVRILSIQGIKDITEIKINGIDGNITLSKDKIPVLGSVTNV